MPRRFIRLLLVLVLLLSSEVWALGLGEIRLNSGLNQPLRAEVELLGATPEELANLTVALASSSTFRRYGIDRPFYLQDMVFDVIASGQADGNYVRIRSAAPITEPFLTFLLEITWSRGRLLREYTVLLDPPTFAPPSSTQPLPVVTAPQRSSTTDSGRIVREEPAPRQTPASPPPSQFRPSPHRPVPESALDDTPFDTAEGGDYIVARGETLWGIASAMRPDRRLTMNQTMLAIFAANPHAFQGNINILSAGASLRFPSADDIYRIDRRDAVTEVRRQHYAWGGEAPPPPVLGEPFVEADTQPSLTLVPPDEDPIGLDTGIDGYGDEPMTREQEVLDRIAELEAADVPIQHTLIEIRNNELAALRAELAEIRGEVYELPVADTAADDEFIDDAIVDDAADAEPEPIVDEPDATATQGPASVLSGDSGWLPGWVPSVDEALGWLTSIWAIIAGAVLAVLGLLIWFLRRDKEEEEDSGAWGALDADEARIDPLDATGLMQTPQVDESIVVVEQESALSPLDDDTVRIEVPEADPTVVMAGIDDAADMIDSDETSQMPSLDDTFSSETAVNLDQSDPIAEADFHMAYGLYDQAADLINGALQVEPNGQDLLTKLCEIYFVWGNRDAFIDAADRLKAAVGGGDSADWDKIVIMGQQIAADHDLFAGAGVAMGTQEVDLSFDADDGGAAELDMEFGADDGGGDIIDLGAGVDAAQAGDGEPEFMLDDDATQVAEMPADLEASGDFEVTAEMPTFEASSEEATADDIPVASQTGETPTIEEQFAGFDPTSELPTIDDSTLDSAIAQSGLAAEETAEINLDDLDLGIDGLAETEMASLDDSDVGDGDESLADTDVYEDADEVSDITGKNPQVDPEVTGVQTTLDPTPSGLAESLKVEQEDLTPTAEMRLAPDETGVNPMINIALTEEDADLSDNDATLLASALDEDAGNGGLGDDEKTMLASLDDDDNDDDFDFVKTEALTPEDFTGITNLGGTGEMPALSSTDANIELDELTAALKIGGIGDTLEQPRDDATAEYPLPSMSDDEVSKTMTLGATELSDELQEARTMTEVGTKLDLARAYVDMGDPAGARSILDEVLDEGDESQRQQAQSLLESLPT